MIPIGVLFVVASWLAAPGPRALGARRYLAPGAPRRLWPYVALALIAVFLVLTGPVSDVSRYIVVAALTFLGAHSGSRSCGGRRGRSSRMRPAPRRSTSCAPGSGGGEHATHGRACRAAPPPAPAAAPAGADVTARLASLAELHASGALTDEEFASAKARVLPRPTSRKATAPNAESPGVTRSRARS